MGSEPIVMACKNLYGFVDLAATLNEREVLFYLAAGIASSATLLRYLSTLKVDPLRDDRYPRRRCAFFRLSKRLTP